MRGTFTHVNPDVLNDIQTMLDLGFNELSMEPVVCAKGDPSALTEEKKYTTATALTMQATEVGSVSSPSSRSL